MTSLTRRIACVLLAWLPALPMAQPSRISACDGRQAVQWRTQALAQVNLIRARGARCGAMGYFPPTGPVVWGDGLVDLAHTQAKAISVRGELVHEGEGGMGLAERAGRAGYRFARLAENLANGWDNPRELIADWASSDRHCANLMDPKVTELALVCVSDTHRWPWWVMTLGSQRRISVGTRTAGLSF